MDFHDAFYQIIFTSPDKGFIPGDQGRIIRTMDGGMSWEYIYTGFNEGSTQYSSLCFPSKDTAYVIGNDHVIRSTDAGETWTEVLVYDNLGFGYMRFFDNNTGIVHNSGDIFHTYDAGQTWEHTTQNGPGGDAYFLNPDTGYTVLSYGELRRTLDGGVTWHTVNVFYPYIHDVYFLDHNNGYACGQYGALFKTTDAGETWTTQVTGTDNYILFVNMIDTSTVFAGGEGGMLLKYESEFPVEIPEEMPGEFLLQAFPNPFSDLITLGFTLDKPSKVKLDLFDLSGKLVKTRNLSQFPAGEHLVTLRGNELPEGVYILSLTVGNKKESVKLVKN